MKYNPSDDYIYLLVNGTWVQWKKASLIITTILSSEGFESDYSLGSNVAYSSYTNRGGLSYTSNYLVGGPNNNNNGSIMSNINGAIDLTNRTTLYVKVTAESTYTVTIDVSSLTGNHYLSLGASRISDTVTFRVYVKTALGTYAESNSVASGTQTISAVQFTITDIWAK